MCVKLNSLFDSEKKVYYDSYTLTHLLKQDINMKTMCPNYLIEFSKIRKFSSNILHILLNMILR